MSTSWTVVWIVMCGLTCASPMPALAQASNDNASPQSASGLHITPFLAVGSDFASRVGASVRFGVTRDVSVELEAGWRQSDVALVNATVSLLHDLPRVRRVRPYIAAGVGVEHYAVPLELPTADCPQMYAITLRKVGMATSYGGGVHVPIAGRWTYRSDIRWLRTAGSPEGWRIYNGASLHVGRR